MVGSVQVHNRRESVALDMKAYSHLSAQERIRIDELRNREGLGVCQIALNIGLVQDEMRNAVESTTRTDERRD